MKNMKTIKVSQQKFIALHFNLRTDLEQQKRKKSTQKSIITDHHLEIFPQRFLTQIFPLRFSAGIFRKNFFISQYNRFNLLSITSISLNRIIIFFGCILLRNLFIKLEISCFFLQRIVALMIQILFIWFIVAANLYDSIFIVSSKFSSISLQIYIKFLRILSNFFSPSS